MGEGIKKVAGESLEKLQHALFSAAVKKLAEKHGTAPHEIARAALEAFRIEPEYVAERNPKRFEQMREQLNTEGAAGILIANHPGFPDLLPIASMITRRDVMYFMGDFATDILQRVSGPEHFVEGSFNPVKLRAALIRAKEHIARGGLLVIFPTGGHESPSNFQFQSGFGDILKTMKPTDMVYACKIFPEDVTAFGATGPSGPEVLASIALGGNGRTEKTPTSPIRVDESLDNALNYQRASSGARGRSAKNRALTNHYIGRFVTDGKGQGDASRA